MRPDQQHGSKHRERLDRLEQCRAEILDVMAKYGGVSIEWDCDDCSDTFGITGDHVVITDSFVTLPIYAEDDT